MTTRKFAVASDLHAYPPGEESSSTGSLETPLRGATNSSPLEALIGYVQRHGIRADTLLCPGDLGDHAHEASQRYVWEELMKLKAALHATELLATAGNHDLDSRFVTSEFDPEDSLRSLTPSFPIPEGPETLNDLYWSRHYAIREYGDLRMVILNSSAYHGYRSEGPSPEHNHGRISERTLNWLRTSLASEGPRRANILVCHHHLQRPPVDDLDVSEMRGAGPLLEMLEGVAHGPWLVIHGHKHYPWLSYANGGASAPAIFSAGSLTGATWSLPVSNQFYVVDVGAGAPLGDDSMVVAGTFRAWDYQPNGRWAPATYESGLPDRGGFGLREGIRASALRIRRALESSEAPYMTIRELQSVDRALSFLTPRDEAYVLEYLESNLDVVVETDSDRASTQLAIGAS